MTVYQYLLANGYSQSKGAIELGVTRCTLKKYLDDKKGLNHQVIDGRLFAALGVII